jgi:hypothetical protein
MGIIVETNAAKPHNESFSECRVGFPHAVSNSQILSLIRESINGYTEKGNSKDHDRHQDKKAAKALIWD